MNSELSNLPEKESLKEEYMLLKREYVKLLTDKDCMLEWGKPQLEALYIIKIGRKQLDLLELKFEVKRLKKMTKLAVAYLNRNEQIDWDKISETVDAVLTNDYSKIIEEASRIMWADKLLSNLASPEHSAELRKIYRHLAKELHPDVNKDLTENQINLWHAVKRAYEYGDLESLRALSIVTRDTELMSEKLSLADFELQNALLKAGIEKLISEIEQIRSVFPFTIEKDLRNEEWVKIQNEQTELLMQMEIKEKAKYEERLELLKSV